MFFFFYPPSFAKRLNELRVSKNLTMEQLSKDLSTTRGTISNFENEQRKPSLDMVIKIADYFQVSIDYLVGRTNDPTFHRTKKDWWISVLLLPNLLINFLFRSLYI